MNSQDTPKNCNYAPDMDGNNEVFFKTFRKFGNSSENGFTIEMMVKFLCSINLAVHLNSNTGK